MCILAYKYLGLNTLCLLTEWESSGKKQLIGNKCSQNESQEAEVSVYKLYLC